MRRFVVSLVAIGIASVAGAVALTDVHSAITLARPASGYALATITGTLTATALGETIGTSTDAPYDATGDTLDALFYDDQENDALLATGSYTGPLLSFFVRANTPFGVYDHFFNSTNAATFYVDSSVPTLPSGSATFSVTVSPVPEPLSVATLGLGLFGLRRRRS